METDFSYELTRRPISDEVIRAILLSRGKRLDIADLATLLGYSESQLRRLFLDEFGRPLGAASINIRVESAAYYLVTTDLSVLEISIECGYATTFGLIHAFKLYFEQTPGAYRIANRERVPMFPSNAVLRGENPPTGRTEVGVNAAGCVLSHVYVGLDRKTILRPIEAREPRVASTDRGQTPANSSSGTYQPKQKEKQKWHQSEQAESSPPPAQEMRPSTPAPEAPASGFPHSHRVASTTPARRPQRRRLPPERPQAARELQADLPPALAPPDAQAADREVIKMERLRPCHDRFASASSPDLSPLGLPWDHPYSPMPDPQTGALLVDPDISLKGKGFDLEFNFYYSSEYSQGGGATGPWGQGRNSSVSQSATGTNPVTLTRGDFSLFVFDEPTAGVYTAETAGCVSTLTMSGSVPTEWFPEASQHYCGTDRTTCKGGLENGSHQLLHS